MMLLKILAIFLGFLIAILGMLGIPSSVMAANNYPWWEFQAIDTMKYSRDQSRERLNDPSFNRVIEDQTKKIAATGATHIAIATPYDEEFIPILKRWVKAARDNELKIWFRGNFSGWEEWFEYEQISRQEHIELTENFINSYPQLFENGDYFSACPECENGGPGDPRLTGDVAGHRKFLIDEYRVTRQAFNRTGKNIISNLHSMNGDVARLIMDEKTTKELGGVVTIDHYVESPAQLAEDVRQIAAASKGKVILGEVGAPIPDIHGNMTPEEQAAWVDETLTQLEDIKELVGVSYWVNVGGSTQLWNSDGTPRPVVETVTSHFTPSYVSAEVRSNRNKPLNNVMITSTHRTSYSDEKGNFWIPLKGDEQELIVSATGYLPRTVSLFEVIGDKPIISLTPEKLSFLDKLHQWWNTLFN